MDASLRTPPDLAALEGTSAWHLGGYHGMVKRLDEVFGRMVDVLRSLDLLDDTIVIFTSDHACHFKTRNAEYRRSCHESAVRMPTIRLRVGRGGSARARLLPWIARIEGGDAPGIVEAPSRPSRQYRTDKRMPTNECARDSRLGMEPGG